MRNKLYTIIFGFLAVPLAVYAQDLEGFLNGTVAGIINSVIQFLIVLVSLVFIAGVIKYIFSAGDAEKAAEARHFVVFSLVGLVLIFVFWGLVNVVINSLGLDNTPPSLPNF
ncbi:MAG: hypothetical protein O2794_04205 [bacterium]|nr:hypothetical protein [bacterium]